MQIVTTKKGRFLSSFIKFVLADYLLQMTKASSLNLIRATFNTAAEVHKFNLNQGWVFFVNSNLTQLLRYCNEKRLTSCLHFLPFLQPATCYYKCSMCTFTTLIRSTLPNSVPKSSTSQQLTCPQAMSKQASNSFLLRICSIRNTKTAKTKQAAPSAI